MAAVTIRAATPDDAPELRGIAHEGWRSAYGDFLSERVLEAVRREWHTEADFREYVTGEDGAFFVAEGEEVVGYVSATMVGVGRGTVGALYVEPTHWGEGIGTRLFGHALDALSERGATRATVEVFARNDVGRSFYESRGFAVADEYEEDLFGETATVVTYARDIRGEREREPSTSRGSNTGAKN